MKSWKLGIAALAMSTALSSGAFAQEASWSEAQQKAQVVQSRWQYQDQDRDRDDDHDRDRDRNDRKQDRHDNGRWHNDRRNNGNNGWYGNGRNDRDRDDVYRNNRNGGYPVYGNNGQYGTYGRGRYNTPAAQFGYQDGLRYGQNDAARGKSYNATGSGVYESADRGYNSSFGDRSMYREQYRQAYQQGYNDGYSRSTYGRRF